MSFSHFPLKPQKRFEQTGATEARFSQHLQEGAGLTQQKDPSLPTGLGQRLPDERVLGGQIEAGPLEVRMCFDWTC